MRFRSLSQSRPSQQFFGELAEHLEAGVPILTALEIIAARQKSRKWSDSILLIREELKAGGSLSFAVQRYPLFPAHCVATLAWGERSGFAADLRRAIRLLAAEPMPEITASAEAG